MTTVVLEPNQQLTITEALSRRRDSDLKGQNNATTNQPHFHWRPLARPRSLQAPDSLRLSQVQHVAPPRDRSAVSRPQRAHYPDFLHFTRPYAQRLSRSIRFAAESWRQHFPSDLFADAGPYDSLDIRE